MEGECLYITNSQEEPPNSLVTQDIIVNETQDIIVNKPRNICDTIS
jgi:hypothetical protein